MLHLIGSGLGMLPVAGLVYALHESNTAGKVIVVLLICGSVWAWTIMLTKVRVLKLGLHGNHAFLGAYRHETSPVGVYLKRRRYGDAPLYVLYDHALRALGRAVEARGVDQNDLFMGQIGKDSFFLRKPDIRSVRAAAERSLADQALLMEESMGLLATAASAAPFLGLLGTVWGVMEAFGGMASQGSAMLSAVAPGISGALLTTVIGLMVALPSAIGYNLLGDQIRRISVEMSNFVEELMSDLECYYEEGSES